MNKVCDPAGRVQEIKGKTCVDEAVADIEEVIGAGTQVLIEAFGKKELLAVTVQVPAHHKYRNEAEAKVNDVC